MAAIIFDLDGTIADSFDFVADYLAFESKQAPLKAEQKQALKGLSMVAMARKLGISWLRMLGVFRRGRQTMRTSMKQVHPFAGMPEVIAKLHAEGHELFVVSSNSVHNVRTFLHHYKLHQYFLQLYGSIGIFSKTPTLRKLIKEQKLDPKNCVYVGDELSDVEASQAVGIRVAAVSWGFADRELLKNLKPTKLVDTPAELMSFLEEV